MAEGAAVPVAVPVRDAVPEGVPVPVAGWLLLPGWLIWFSERGVTLRSEIGLPLLSLMVYLKEKSSARELAS